MPRFLILWQMGSLYSERWQGAKRCLRCSYGLQWPSHPTSHPTQVISRWGLQGCSACWSRFPGTLYPLWIDRQDLLSLLEVIGWNRDGKMKDSKRHLCFNGPLRVFINRELSELPPITKCFLEFPKILTQIGSLLERPFYLFAYLSLFLSCHTHVNIVTSLELFPQSHSKGEIPGKYMLQQDSDGERTAGMDPSCPEAHQPFPSKKTLPSQGPQENI